MPPAERLLKIRSRVLPSTPSSSPGRVIARSSAVPVASTPPALLQGRLVLPPASPTPPSGWAPRFSAPPPRPLEHRAKIRAS
ncbi:hypothetical protein NDU88_008231 [Pleurodeles waltl]|uniref:Uncharacterized protein n=1 Tax=Pleurodeles waltl TaxID=8319 RepID=A0AAV7P073_PLEWA|nr:hypothetical protein NDU88_008231 [Pleurodeles waltl]